ncbi:MAG: Fe-S cluster assembly protein SufD [Pseudomonadota bacterium]|nr:Fe-S cluster assembly protein SufD [Pseudomonadota bacterium]
MSLVEHFGAEHARLAAQLPGAGHPAVDSVRGAALARFRSQGLPQTRLEDWKYTSLAGLEHKPLPVAASAGSLTAGQLAAQAALPQAVHRLVFIDGHFAPEHSFHQLPAGALAASLAARLAAAPQDGLPADDPAASALSALNLAFSADGLELEVAAGVVVEQPILLLWVGSQPEHSTFPALRVRLGQGARACLVEQHLSLHAGTAVNTAVARISLAGQAELQHIKVQAEGPRVVHLSDCAVELAAGARLRSLVLALGGQLGREDLRIALQGRNAAAELDGLYLARGRRHLDHHTTVVHASPDCSSRQDYRGIIDDAARAVFNGRVVVARDAQHTDAQQTNANLLLSDAAEIDTKPQLEIFADDVRCSHGATVGQLDAAELFYLRSRGLDEAQARTLVTFAFAARCLAPVPAGTPLHDGLRRLLLAALPGGEQLENLTP